MPGLAAVNPGDILLAVETQLVAFGVVGAADAIYWLRAGDEPVAKPTGKRDILLVVSNQLVHKPAQVGGGRRGLRFELLIEVHLRSINLLDRVNTQKDWLIEHWGIADTILDALETFGPTDTGGNEMTIEGLRIDQNVVPHPDRMTPKWGESIGTWRCHYLPKVSQQPIG